MCPKCDHQFWACCVQLDFAVLRKYSARQPVGPLPKATKKYKDGSLAISEYQLTVAGFCATQNCEATVRQFGEHATKDD